MGGGRGGDLFDGYVMGRGWGSCVTFNPLVVRGTCWSKLTLRGDLNLCLPSEAELT